jgi:hypothetical protein
MNKGLAQSTLEKLESELKSEAREAYCDGQVAKTNFERSELEDDIRQETSKIYRTASSPRKIKELETELAVLKKSKQGWSR